MVCSSCVVHSALLVMKEYTTMEKEQGRQMCQLSQSQLSYLEQVHRFNPQPSPECMQSLAKLFDVQIFLIKEWFHYRNKSRPSMSVCYCGSPEGTRVEEGCLMCGQKKNKVIDNNNNNHVVRTKLEPGGCWEEPPLHYPPPQSTSRCTPTYNFQLYPPPSSTPTTIPRFKHFSSPAPSYPNPPPSPAPSYPNPPPYFTHYTSYSTSPYPSFCTPTHPSTMDISPPPHFTPYPLSTSCTEVSPSVVRMSAWKEDAGLLMPTWSPQEPDRSPEEESVYGYNSTAVNSGQIVYQPVSVPPGLPNTIGYHYGPEVTPMMPYYPAPVPMLPYIYSPWYMVPPGAYPTTHN